jgi:polysaccharide export outer membrane protein
MRWLTFTALVALAAVSALNWRAQLQTQRKLDALSAALAERPAPAAAAPALAPAPVEAKVAPPGAPVERGHVKLPPYVIDPPDLLSIEVVVKDPKTGATDRLPQQPISGRFLVRPDGTVGLGLWGSASVAGLTLDQAAKAVREQVVKGRPAELAAANVTALVDVIAYNSKVYYVITDSAGGEQVVRLPITGNETVLDAVAQVGGHAPAPGKRKVWVSRPAPKAGRPAQTLPVDWRGIAEQGVTATNYQLLPGDRVYVKQAAD